MTDDAQDYAARVDAFSRVLSAPERTDRDRTEDKAYRDALAIAWIGASNTVSVARTIAETISALRSAGIDRPDWHPAVRAMVGQLAYLTGQGLGPESDDLATVRDRSGV